LDNTRFAIDSVVGTGVDINIKFGFGQKGIYKILVISLRKKRLNCILDPYLFKSCGYGPLTNLNTKQPPMF